MRLGDTRGQRIGGDPIRTFGEQAHTVDVKRKLLTPLVGLLAQFDRAYADFVTALVEDGFVRLST